MAKVSPKSANQSIELITLDSSDATVQRVAQEWLAYRRDKLTPEQANLLQRSRSISRLRIAIMQAQAYKVERIRRDLIHRLEELNRELSSSQRQVGYWVREDNIKMTFHSSSCAPDTPLELQLYQTKIIWRWRDLRRKFMRLKETTTPEERLELIKEIFAEHLSLIS